MSISLVDALRQVALEPGQVYQCQVGDLSVEVRVAQSAPLLLPDPLTDSDVMLDPWTDLPTPTVVSVLPVSPGKRLLPDEPEIPAFEDRQ